MKPLIQRCAPALLAVAALCIALPVAAQNIAVVNGKPIPKSKYDELLAAVTREGRPDSPELDQLVKDQLINSELVRQEADRRNLIKDPEVQAELDRARDQILVQTVALEYFKANPPTEAEMHAEYDAAIKNAPTKDYHAHHILVAKESEAKAIIKKLQGGASFEELAKAQSQDKGSAQQGGDLDWAPAGAFVPEFNDALAKMQKGQITTTPVKTKFGYHVIRLDDVRDHTVPTYDQIKPKLMEALMQDQNWRKAKFKAMVDELRAKSKIE